MQRKDNFGVTVREGGIKTRSHDVYEDESRSWRGECRVDRLYRLPIRVVALSERSDKYQDPGTWAVMWN